MKLYSEGNNYKLYEGNMLDMLEVIEPNIKMPKMNITNGGYSFETFV